MNNLLIPVSLNSSQREVNRVSRAGKRKSRMSAISSMTFLQLIDEMERQVSSGQITAAVFANLKSALRSYLRNLGLSEQTMVGSHLRRSVYRNIRQHIESLKAEGRDAAYIANRKSLMAKWSSLVAQMDRRDAEAHKRKTPLQAALEDVLTKASMRPGTLAREAGIPKASLRRWLQGGSVQQRAMPSLHRLERFFALEPGFLVNLAAVDKTSGSSGQPEVKPIAYRLRLGLASQDPYLLKEISPALKREWLDFLAHKTDKVPLLERQSRGKWTATKYATRKASDSNWFCTVDGLHVSTASVVWTQVTSYLGWLCRPSSNGGAGYSPEDVQTLAWLADKALIRRYMHWTIRRADGKAHNGVVNIAKLVASLTHPVHGYLKQLPHLSQSLPEEKRPADWLTHCSATFAWARSTHNTFMDEGIEFSREPTEAIEHILALPNPLEAVADMVVRMRSNRPFTGGIEEAIWSRDMVLVKLLSSNPLRAKNLKLLTYRADNTGELYRMSSGGWAIRIPREAFKNAKGAAKNRDYDMPVDANVWGDIEEYLKTYRPMLPDAEKTDLFFLSSNDDEQEHDFGVWHSLNRRVFTLTRRYLWNCQGIASHAFRHILATSILKMQPEEWETAAQILHDEVETVKKNYAHLKCSDGAARMSKILGSTFARM